MNRQLPELTSNERKNSLPILAVVAINFFFGALGIGVAWAIFYGFGGLILSRPTPETMPISNETQEAIREIREKNTELLGVIRKMQDDIEKCRGQNEQTKGEDLTGAILYLREKLARCKVDVEMKKASLQEELEGKSGTGRPGYGPVARKREMEYKHAFEECKKIEDELSRMVQKSSGYSSPYSGTPGLKVFDSLRTPRSDMNVAMPKQEK